MLACVLAHASAAFAGAPPPFEPVEVESALRYDAIPGVPSGALVTQVELAPDPDWLIVELTIDGGDHAAIVRQGGGDFRCLTCGLVPRAIKVEAFPDERRLWFGDASGQDQAAVPGFSGETGDRQYSVLECSPSLYDCDERRALEVQFPIDSLREGAQNREAGPDSIDGSLVTWNEVRTTEGTRMTIARLVREAERYVLADPRVFNPPYSPEGGAQDFVDGGRFYEGASWWNGGRLLKYGTTRTALNYEIFELDTVTGRRRPLTQDLDYNETATYSPDGRWVVYSSARGLDRMDVFTQLVRPPLIDMVSFGQVGRIALTSNRRCMNEAWLMDAEGQRGGYGGQPLITEDNWTIRSRQWFPDGRRLLLEEELIPNVPEPSAAAARKRVRIVRLPARRAVQPLRTLSPTELRLSAWSVPAAEYQGMSARQLSGRTIAGPAGGTATVDFAGTFAAGSWTVRYDRWSEDGRSFISGTERLTTPNPIVNAVWSADLTLQGERTGRLTGDLTIGPGNRFSGDVASEVDGRRLEGVPIQADCPGIRRPQLEVAVVRRRSLPGGRRAITLRVLARAAEDPVARPVRHAFVSAPERGRAVGPRRLRTRTDTRGHATLIVRRAAEIRVRAGGFVSSAVPAR